MIGSTPTLAEFVPLPMQAKILKDIASFDYSLGTHEILLSGSLGSAKSIVLAHIGIRHCIENEYAGCLIARRALPDLKDTLYKKIIEHMGSVNPYYFKAQDSIARIKFRNGSNIIARSWADKHYLKLRSLELSHALIEELTENEEPDPYMELFPRVGRLPHINKPIVISATNPASPSHWAYKHFIEPNLGGNKHPTRHVYYSRTEDNPYLPTSYIEQLKRDLDPKLARRMLYGEWIELTKDVVYYSYDSSRQYSKDTWKPRDNTTIQLSFDFNIGVGKPLSAVLMAYEDDAFHVFSEVVIHGARTADALDEMFARNLLKPGRLYEIDGDAAGKARSTSSHRSDYDIIRDRLDREGISYVYKVRASNPPVRTRHNIVNAYCLNEHGQTRLFIHNCPTADKGLRLTELRKGSNYIENDDNEWQHISTAIGYAIVRKHDELKRPLQRTEFL